MYLAYQSEQYAVPALRRRGSMGDYSGRRRRRGLSALTPDQAAQTAMPTSSISSTPGFTQAVYSGIVAAAQAGQFVNFNPSGCSGAAPAGSIAASILSTSSGVALKIAPLTGPAAPFVIVGAAIEGVFAALFGAHAAKVAKEQQVECAAVPAANDALQAIDQAVQAGTITPAQGISGMQNLLADFKAQVSSIVKMSSSQCNAGCVWIKTLEAITAEKISQYQDMETGAVASTSPLAPVTGAVSKLASSTGIPPIVIYAAVALLVIRAL